jgi:carbon-monoxide dehydrogenase medium subunit
VALGSDGTVAGCRVAVTGAASVPQRLAGVEQALAGKKPEASVLSAAAGAAGAGLTFRGDLFASSEYRAHLTRVLTGRALKQALERAAR